MNYFQRFTVITGIAALMVHKLVVVYLLGGAVLFYPLLPFIIKGKE
jgi:hypothetical protein